MILRCSRCNTPVRVNDVYCSRCSAKICDYCKGAGTVWNQLGRIICPVCKPKTWKDGK